MMFVLEPIVTSLTLDMRELDPGGMKVYPWLRRDASGCVLVVEFRLLRLLYAYCVTVVKRLDSKAFAFKR